MKTIKMWLLIDGSNNEIILDIGYTKNFVELTPDHKKAGFKIVPCEIKLLK